MGRGDKVFMFNFWEREIGRKVGVVCEGFVYFRLSRAERNGSCFRFIVVVGSLVF